MLRHLIFHLTFSSISVYALDDKCGTNVESRTASKNKFRSRFNADINFVIMYSLSRPCCFPTTRKRLAKDLHLPDAGGWVDLNSRNSLKTISRWGLIKRQIRTVRRNSIYVWILRNECIAMTTRVYIYIYIYIYIYELNTLSLNYAGPELDPIREHNGIAIRGNHPSTAWPLQLDVWFAYR